MKIVCIKKFKDNAGRIIGYRLGDVDTKEQRDIKAEALKEAIRNNRIQVDNLQLTSDGRLIDKKIERKTTNVVNNINKNTINTKININTNSVNPIDRDKELVKKWADKCKMLGINTDEFVIDEAYGYGEGLTLHKYTGNSRKVIVPPVEAIEECAFEGNKAIEEIVIPNTVKGILIGAFSRCTSLKKISIPKSVELICDFAFEGCTSIEEMELNSDCVYEGMFKGCVSLKRIKLSSDIAGIGAEAFKGCTSLSEINLRDCKKLKQIGACAFSKCNSLVNIDLSNCNELEQIDAYAFSKCDSLVNVDLGNCKLAIIGDAAFESCTSLQTLSLPKSLKKIGDNAFYCCNSLTTVNINKEMQMETLGYDAFGECYALNEYDLIKKLGFD